LEDLKPKPVKGYLPTIDGWRALAILLVVGAHTSNGIFAPGGTSENELWYSITRYGAYGVDIFFGISGFLICSRLLEEYEAHRKISLKGFYIRRVCRIVPPYALFVLVCAMLGLCGLIALTRVELLTSITFTRNFAHYEEASDAWFTAHLWSLAVEEHFYLLWPGLLVFWSPPKAKVKVFIVIALLSIWRSISFKYQLMFDFGFYHRTDIRLDSLLWGCWFALVARDPLWRERFRHYLGGIYWWVACAIFVLLLIFPVPFAMTWIAIVIPALITGTVLNPDGLPGKVFELAPLRWVGRISYSLYIWQNLFLLPVGVEAKLGNLQSMPFNVLASFAAATLCYYLIERPMIKLGHKLAPPTTPGRA